MNLLEQGEKAKKNGISKYDLLNCKRVAVRIFNQNKNESRIANQYFVVK